MTERKFSRYFCFFLIAGMLFWSSLFADAQKIILPEANLSVVMPDSWGRAVPSQGYSLLLGKMEPQGKFRANMTLMITHIPALANQTFSLEQLFQSVKNNLNKTLQDKYDNLTPTKMMILEKEILVVTYDILRDDIEMRCKQYYVFSGETRYMFTSVATKANFHLFESDFDSVVQSLQFGQKPAAF